MNKKYLNELCKCGHKRGKHSEKGGCQAEINAKAKYVNDAYCKCKIFDFEVQDE